MARVSGVELLAVLVVASVASLPASAQEPDLEEVEADFCYFGPYLTTGAVLKGVEAEPVDEGKDALPELPTIEDDGR